MRVKLAAMGSGRAVLILLAENDAEHIVVDRIVDAKRAGNIFSEEGDVWNGAPTFELTLSAEGKVRV